MRRDSLIMMGTVLAAGAALWAGCGDDSETCPPDKVCTGGTGVGGSGVGGGAGGEGGSGVCQITCTPWETDGTSDDATRTCNQCPGQPAPATTATLPALDFGYFKCDVAPIFNRACSQQACHGNDDGRALRIYGRGRYRLNGEMFTQTNCPPGTTQQIDFGVDCTGSIECACFAAPKSQNEWRRNYDSARGLLLDFITAAPIADPADSELLTQPTEGSGKAHANFKFFNVNDGEHTILRNWLGGTANAGCVTND